MYKGKVVTNDYQGRYYEVEWNAVQDEDTNTSKLDWYVRAYGGDSYYYKENLLIVNIDGGIPVYRNYTSVNRSKGPIASGSKTIYHNDNGDKSIVIKIEAAIDTSLTNPNLTGSKTFTLDRIDRNSTINRIPDFNIEDSFTIDITKSPAAKSHTIDVYLGSKLIDIWHTVASDNTYKFNGIKVDEIYEALPNSKQGTLSFRLRSYSDTNGVYIIGSVSTKNVTVTLSKGASCKLQVTADDIVSGTMVAGVSRPTFRITDVEVSPYASIKSYNIKVKDFFDVNRQEYKSGVIPSGITEMVVEASVTDTRGNIARATYVFVVLPYSAPNISRFEIYRSDSNGQADSSGNHVRMHIQASVTPLTVNEVDGNSIKWNLYGKEKGTTSWVSMPSSDATGTELSISMTFAGYDTAKSYDFKLEVIDNYNTTISLAIVPTAGYTMSWGKEGVGIGKVLEQGVLDIGGDTYINDNTIHSSKKGEFWNHKSDDISGWMTWYNNSQASAKVGILTPNDERFSIVSDYSDITLESRGSSATFSNGVFKPVQESTFTLYNGWTRGDTTAKAIKTVDGMVHLQGVLKYGTKEAWNRILRLPVGMRPADLACVTAFYEKDTVKGFVIDSDGYMENATTVGTVIYLDGISFYAEE